MDKPKPMIRHFDTCNAIGLDDLEGIIECNDHVTSELGDRDNAWTFGHLNRSYVVDQRLLWGGHLLFPLGRSEVKAGMKVSGAKELRAPDVIAEGNLADLEVDVGSGSRNVCLDRATGFLDLDTGRNVELEKAVGVRDDRET